MKERSRNKAKDSFSPAIKSKLTEQDSFFNVGSQTIDISDDIPNEVIKRVYQNIPPFQQAVVCRRICWNTTGTFVCYTNEDIIEYLQFVNHGIISIAARKIYDERISSVKYLDECVMCFNYQNKVGIWDSRLKKQQEIINKCQKINQEYDKLTTNTRKKYITISSKNVIKNYDLRSLKIPINSIESDTLINDFLWSQHENQVLLTGGGSGTNGVLKLFDQQFSLLEELQLHYHPIINLSIDRESKKMTTLGEQNLVQVLQVCQILCESVLSMSEQKEIKKCSLSHKSDLLAVEYENQVEIYKTKDLSSPIKWANKSRNSETSWNPTQNILAYIEDSYAKLMIL